MKDLLIFMASYLGLSIVYAIMFIGIVFISLFTLKVLFNMHEDKWDAFFNIKMVNEFIRF